MNRLTRQDAEDLARRCARDSRVPYSVWQHPSNGRFKIVSSLRPDPPKPWELVTLVEVQRVARKGAA
jgi:hypothetical protein